MRKLYIFIFALVCFAAQAQVRIGTTNYSNLKGAFEAINSGAKTGAIVIELTSDVTDNDAATLFFSNYYGTANYTSITIRPSGEGTRTVNINGDLKFSGSNVTIDGENRTTFKKTTAEYGRGVIWFKSEMNQSNLTVKNCKIMASKKGYGVYFEPINFMISEVLVSSCEISAANVQEPMRVGIYSNQLYGGSIRDATAVFNKIHDYGDDSPGVVSAGIMFERGVKFYIRENILYQTVGRHYGNGYSIFLSNLLPNASEVSSIIYNQIGGASDTNTGMLQVLGGSFRGINVTSSLLGANCEIKYNAVRNVSLDYNSESATGEFVGIGVLKSDAEIIGNAIGSISTPNSIVCNFVNTSNASVCGIYTFENKDCVISDNTIGGISVNANGHTWLSAINLAAGQNPVATNFTCNNNTIGSPVSGSIKLNGTDHCELTGIIVAKGRRGLVTNNTVRSITGNFPIYGTSAVIGISYSDFDYLGIARSISSNTIYNLRNDNLVGPTSTTGIQIYSTNASSPPLTVDNNKISGLYLAASAPYSAAIGLDINAVNVAVRNNMVAVGNEVTGGAAVYGIQLSSATSDDGTAKIFSNNSIYIGGTKNTGNATSSALDLSVASAVNTNLYDNILTNMRTNATSASGPNYSLMYSGKVNMRSNILHGTGSGYVFAPFMNSLAQLASHVFSSNTQYFSDPKFIAPNAMPANLHIRADVPTIVEGRAFASSGTDIDGQLRSSLTPNDIGADAGNFTAMLAPTISSLSSNAVCGPTYFNIYGTNLADVTSVHLGATALSIYSKADTVVTVEAPAASLSGTIKVENAVAAAVSTQTVAISPLPAITAQPAPRTICPAQGTSFSITATNAVSYQWRHNGTPLANNTNYSNVTTATLTVNNANFSMSGQYDVVVYGGLSSCSVTSAPASLSVGNAEITIVPSGSTTLCQGESVTLTPMVHSPALKFDGADDYFDFPGVNPGDFTMTFWVKTTQIGSTGPHWFDGNGIVDGHITAQGTFGTALVGDKLGFGFSHGVGSTTVLSNTAINTGDWVHVAVSRSTMNSDLKIYINGVLDASLFSDYAYIPLSNNSMRAGGLLDGSSFLDGAIDDIRIYTRVLSNPELVAMKQGQFVNGSMLNNYYALDENFGEAVWSPSFALSSTLMNGAQWINRLVPAVFENPLWSTGETTQTIMANQSAFYTFSGNGGLCNAPAQGHIAVFVNNPQVYVDAPNGNFYCGNEPVQLNGNGAQTYTWSPAAGLSATTGETVYASPSVTTLYTLIGTTAEGCSASQSFLVEAGQPTPLSIHSSTTHIAVGQSVMLQVAGGSGVRIWSPAIGLDTTFGDTVVASPTVTTTYTVSGIGCEIPQTITITVLPAPSVTDNALHFDGIDDYVQMPVQSQGISGTFTVAMWVKPSHPTKTMHLFSTRNGTNSNTFDIQIMDGNRIHGDIGDGTNWLTTSADAIFPYQSGQWMHIAYKVTPGAYKIFINGNLIQTGAYPGNAVLYNNNTNFITLGKNDGEDTFLQGTLDDLMISTFDFPDQAMVHAPRYGLPAQIRYNFDEGIAGGSNPTVTLLTNQETQSNLHGSLQNFALNGSTSNWVIGQSLQSQTISMAESATIAYTNTYNPDASTSSGLPVTYISSDSTIASVSGNAILIHNIGTVSIFAQQDGNAFFENAEPKLQQLTITPKSLSLANASAQNKVYDRTTSAAISGTLSGIVGTDHVDFGGVGNFNSFNAGNAIPVLAAPPLLTGADASKYILTQPINLSANITPKNLTVSGTAAANKIYDGNTIAVINGAALIGVISPDVVTVASNAGVFASPNVGTAIPVTSQLTLGGSEVANYAIVQPTGLTANITPMTLTATISGSTSVCAGQPAQLQVAITGTGTYIVTYTDGTLVYTANNYSSGQNIAVVPANTSTFTLVSVTGENVQVTVAGSATVTVLSMTTYYADADGDGFGNAAVTAMACIQPVGYVSNFSDCNDNDPNKHQTFAFFSDFDGDGFGAGTALQVCAANAATAPIGYSVTNLDCNDNNNLVYRTGRFYVDFDGDGYSSNVSAEVCYGATTPVGYVVAPTLSDCDDAIFAIHPNQAEIPYNGVDDNCNGQIDEGFQITTQLLSGSCGATLTAIGSLVQIQTIAPGALYTGWRIRATNGSQVQIIEKNVPHFTMTEFASYAYATTYTIDIELQRNGVWLGYYGSPCFVSTPAILAAGGAGAINPSQCGTTLAQINSVIATTSLQGVTGYRYRITNLTDPLGPNAVQILDRTQHWFTLQMLTRYNYGTNYRIEVAVKSTGSFGGFGAACEIISPVVPSLINCGGYVVHGTTLIKASSVAGVTQYRFRITRTSDNAAATIDRNTNYFTFNMVTPPIFNTGATYAVRIAVMTTGTWSPFGDACEIVVPGSAAKEMPKVKEATAAASFKVMASPSPFTSDFGIDVTSSSQKDIQLKIYDMLGKLIESREVKISDLNLEKIGAQYPSGVYNIVIGQDGIVKTLRVIKR